MNNEYVLVSPSIARMIMVQLQKLPYQDVRELMDELEFGLTNTLTIDTERKTKPNEIGFKQYNLINTEDNDE